MKTSSVVSDSVRDANAFANSQQLNLITLLINDLFDKRQSLDPNLKILILERLSYLNIYIHIGFKEFLTLLNNEVRNILIEEVLKQQSLKELLGVLIGINQYLDSKIGGSNENNLH